jgi:hypothetical protein
LFHIRRNQVSIFRPEGSVPVAVESVPDHEVYVRERMDDDTYQRVYRAMIKGDSFPFFARNIVGWSGPEFDDVPCIDENISRLDPTDPLILAVMGEIDRLHVPRGN